jgi:uncharacterized protein with PQ loop repeat
MVFFSVATSLGSFFQVFKIVSEKSAEAVSTMTWVISLVNNLAWLYYGLMVSDLAVTLSSVFPVLGASLVLVLIYCYSGSNSSK